MNEKSNPEAKSDPQAAARGRRATRNAVLGLTAAVIVATGAAVTTYYVTEADAWVGTVNGQRIDRDVFDRHVAARKKQMESQMGVNFDAPESQTMLGNLKQEVVNTLVEREVLLQGAADHKLGATEEEVETRFKNIKAQFPSEEAFKKTLADNGLDQDALRDQIRDSTKIEKLRDDLTKDATASTADARKFYEEHPEHFKVAEEVKASHILVKTEEEAKALARDLKGGADFADLARSKSEDSGSKAQGGDLGFFGKGRMVAEFEKAAFDLRPGQVSAPVKSSFGWHVIKVFERRPARTKPFDEVDDQILEQLVNTKREQEFRAWLEKHRTDAKVVIRPRYLPPAAPQGMASGSLAIPPIPAHDNPPAGK